MTEVENACRDWLTKHGCPHSMVGLDYVCSAVVELYPDVERRLNLSTDVYYNVGLIYDVTPLAVAQSIHYFIKKIYGMKLINKDSFKCYIAPAMTVPSNREFLYALTDYIRAERRN